MPPGPSPRLLIVDDDHQLLFTIRLTLERQGYRVIEAVDGKVGLELALSERPDLVILDLDMPGLNGMEVCRHLRRLHFAAPILMLTGRVLLEAKVAGLYAGADDYLTKPFEPREFLARVNALLRRHQREAQTGLVLELDAVRINLADRSATRLGQPLTLTKTEYAILELLARNRGRPVSREMLLDVVWGYTRYPNTRTVDTHIWRLRKKLEGKSEAPRWIQRVQGEGYRLADTTA